MKGKTKHRCSMIKHPDKEVFLSTENKDRAVLLCKNCRTYLGVITILNNENKFDGG